MELPNFYYRLGFFIKKQVSFFRFAIDGSEIVKTSFIVLWEKYGIGLYLEEYIANWENTYFDEIQKSS